MGQLTILSTSSNSGVAGAHAGDLLSVNKLHSEMESLRGNSPDEE
jgi:hypothetical protein